MKKFLNLALIGVAFCTALDAGVAKAENKVAENPAVKDAQVMQLEQFSKDLISAVEKNISGPEELFKYISGENRTNSRETPIVSVINSIKGGKYRIICYKEGSNEVVASTDPTLIGKSIDDFKASDGTSVRDRAIKELKGTKNNQAIFTYNAAGESVVNGTAVTHKRVVLCMGRKAFNNLQNSDFKFIVTIGGDIE